MSLDPRSLEGEPIDGRYVLRKRLGEGAFGVVYRGEQRILGVPVRRVAVKLSLQGGLDEDTARTQITEALLLAKAMDEMTDASARAHLVQVYDGGLAADLGGRSYLAMEFVQGTTLADQFRSYPRGVPARLLKKWAREICVALRGLHALVPPLVHRDLKPDNVLLNLDRTVRLVDFGLAAHLVEEGFLPGVAGTLAYMAPETLQGESVPASDLYSLGLLLYEGLTGRHPFDHLVPPDGLPAAAHSDWLYDARRGSPLDPPSRTNSTVDDEFDDAVLCCLEIEPRRRPGTAAELLELLSDQRRPSTPRTPHEEAIRLREEGDLAAAVRILRRALSPPPGDPRIHFALHNELGDDLLALDEPDEAAHHYAEAWRLIGEHAAILRDRDERAAHLEKAAAAYARAGNSYQAARYRRWRDRELGGGRG